MASLKFVIVDEVKHEVGLELFPLGKRRHAPEKRRIVFGAELRAQAVRSQLPAPERRTAVEKFAEPAASKRRIFRELRLHFGGDAQLICVSTRTVRKIRDFEHFACNIIALEPFEIHFLPTPLLLNLLYTLRGCFRYKAPNST